MPRNELSASHTAGSHTTGSNNNHSNNRTRQEEVSESEAASTSEAISSLTYSTSKQTRQTNYFSIYTENKLSCKSLLKLLSAGTLVSKSSQQIVILLSRHVKNLAKMETM